MRIDPNDPRWTAYVLGELDDEELRAIEAILETSPEARKTVDEIRLTAELVSEVLTKEPKVSLTPEQMERISAASAKKERRTLGRWYAWSGLAAAASILLVVLVQTHQAPVGPVYLETANRSLPDAGAELQPPVRSPDAEVGGLVREDAMETATSETEPVPSPPSDGNRVDVIGLYSTVTKSKGTEKKASAAEQVAVNETKDEKVQVVRLDPNQLTIPTPTAPEPPAAAPTEHFALGTGGVPGGALSGISGEGGLRQGRVVPSGALFNEFRASNVVESLEYDRPPDRPGTRPDFNTEAYDRLVDNPFLRVANNPLSTFSIDVDTASYSNLRRFLSQGSLPPKDAVRIEELINYFTYSYPQPGADHPFSVNLEAAAAPWEPAHRLLRIGLKGREIRQDQRPAANLVFLLDVSGSMRPPNKLPLLKQAMKLLVEKLTEKDQVAVAVYAGASGVVLPPTPGDRKEEILAALDRLEAGGSTNGGAGIELAYRLAQTHFIKDGINRVVLATDGDFNVGVTNQGDLTRLVEEKAKSGVFLSVLGFGMDNYKDSTLEKLADQGNGNYGYIDTLNEARKMLVEQMEGTLITIAKDVKIQIEFNPARVEAYRLIGYENRVMRNEDFNDDAKDAGEIGAGHTVTALYEVVPAGQPVPGGSVDPLRYQQPAAAVTSGNLSLEMLTVKLRYKEPDGDSSRLIEVPFADSGREFARASEDVKFVSAVASFGMLLRDSEHKGLASFDAVIEIAKEGIGEDRSGYRREFVKLVEIARKLSEPR